MPPRRPEKRRSKAARSDRETATRGKSRTQKRTAATRKRKKSSKRSAKSKRSGASKKGWAKRRKKQRLIEAMAAHRLQRTEDAQPIGWTQHRAELREINGGLWREIAVEYSESARQAAHLAALADLKIDLLPKYELYDYLSWIGDEYEIEISDMYRMYLGYPVGEQATAAE